MRNIKAVILFAILFCASFTVNATLTYDANAYSLFKLVDSGGLIVSAVSDVEPPTTIVAGTGIASVDADLKNAPAALSGTGLTQESEVSGSAGAPFGASSATVMNGFLIVLENVDSFAKTAVFEFTYEWDISLVQGPASDAPKEAGFASAFFHLTGFAPSGAETLAIDEGAGIVGVADWLFNPFIAFEFDDLVTPAGMSGSTMVTAYVTVPEFSTDSFSVITDAFGAARHISEPLPLTMLLMGIGLVLWRRFPN